MINRRDFFGITAGAAGTLAISPQLLRALQSLQQQGKLIQRAIPSSGELLPAIGLSFSNHAGCADRAALTQVLKTFAENGGRVFDAMHGNPDSEQFHITAANELGIQDRLFWSLRGVPPTGPGGPAQSGGAVVNAYIEALLARVKVPKIDLAMMPVAGDKTHLAALEEEKKAGRIRYIGVQTISLSAQHAQLAAIMRNEPIDFIGIDYDAANRVRAEETILPLALERKIGVMAFFPLGNNGGISCGSGNNLLGRVGKMPLPEWAAEFDAKSWAQFFLKYAISHPAITVARVGTTKTAHMVDDIGGGMGRLPNEATRKRMSELVDALPSVSLGGPPPAQVLQGPASAIVLPPAVLDRYVGDYKDAAGTLLTFRRYGSMMTAKPGKAPETVIYAHTETRFSLGSNFIEFQLDSAGKTTGLVFEAGETKIEATRIH